MEAAEILDEVVHQGWNTDTKLQLVLWFIDQEEPKFREWFRAFLQGKADFENEHALPE